MLLSVVLRIQGQLAYVFPTDDLTWFRGVDAWYHLRLVDNMMVNFPSFLAWDPYAMFPSGAEVGYMPLESWIIAALGQTLPYEQVAAWLPPLLAAGTLIPVYFLTRELVDNKTALLTCGLLSFLPGEFFHRTLLGFADHHMLEVPLMVATLFFLIKAYKSRTSWKWPILAGVSLALYQLAWAGTTFFLLAVLIWVWLEFLLSHQEKPSTLLCRVVSVPLAISLVISAYWLSSVALMLTIAVMLMPAILYLLRKLLPDPKHLLFALSLALPTIIVAADLQLDLGKMFLPLFWGGDSTIAEARMTTISVLTAAYGMSFLLAIAGSIFFPKRRDTALFYVWAILLLLAALGQRRWGYYAAVPSSMLAAFFVFYLHRWVTQSARLAVTVVIIAFLVVPSLTNVNRLMHVPNNIDADWYVALTWLEQNSEPPFANPDAYYSLVVNEKPTYGILSWWDYGNWIIRISHRVPFTSPTQASDLPCRVFTAATEEEALQLLEGRDVRYIVVHKELLTTKWHAIAAWAHKPDLPVMGTYLEALWNGRATAFEQVYQRGSIRIYEEVIDD